MLTLAGDRPQIKFSYAGSGIDAAWRVPDGLEIAFLASGPADTPPHVNDDVYDLRSDERQVRALKSRAKQ